MVSFIETDSGAPASLSWDTEWDTEWITQSERIAFDLLGKPNFTYPGELRYRQKGSLKVNIPPSPFAGIWTDFEAGQSGGMPQLAKNKGHFPGTYLFGKTFPQSSTDKPTVTSSEKSILDYARQLWAAAGEIPTDENHPARRWLARRKLWRPGLALPKAIRWLPERIVVLAAHPLEWISTWPELPTLQAMQTIQINDDGTPGKDHGGLNKRSFGSTKGMVVMLGNPEPTVNRITEGIADALAIAMRYDGVVWATLGVNCYKHWTSMVYLAMKECIIHADNDAAGRAGAQGLVRLITDMGGKAKYVIPTRGKDFAEEMLDFARLPAPDIVQSYADTLLEMHSDWDWGEISRVAVIATGEGIGNY